MSVKMNDIEWDIDSWLKKASYAEVEKLSLLKKTPSLYNEDRTVIYLSSMDLLLNTSSINELQGILKSLANGIGTLEVISPKEYDKLANFRSDFNELCKILNEVQIIKGIDGFNLKYDFSCPEDVLNKLK